MFSIFHIEYYYMYLEDHLEKLRYFYEVAKNGSIKRASSNIHLTQPTLTKAIQVLEESLDKKLFNRLPRGVSLTTEGEILYKYCHTLFASIEEIEKKIKSPKDPFAGSLRVGTYDSIVSYFWPDFLKNFLKSHKNISFELSTGRSSDIQKMLENEELDFIYIVEPKGNKNIECEVLSYNSFYFYESAKKIRTYDSPEEATIILMPSALLSSGGLDSFISEFNFQDRQLFKTSSLESVKELTISGLGIGLLPENVARPLISKGKLKKVKVSNMPKEGISRHAIGIAYQKSKKSSKLLRSLIKELKQKSN